MLDTLYFIPLKETLEAEEFRKLLALISEKRQSEIRRFRFTIDQKLSLFSELLVRILICKIKGINNSQIVFSNNEYGKPYLIDQPDVHFNISHTRNAIAVIVSDKPVGIDIERVSEVDISIAERYFTRNEFSYIIQSSEHQDKRFYEIWTKKEAYIKYTGQGLSLSLQSFDVLLEPLKSKIQTLYQDNYILSVCCKDLMEPFHVMELSEQEVIEMAKDIS